MPFLRFIAMRRCRRQRHAAVVLRRGARQPISRQLRAAATPFCRAAMLYALIDVAPRQAPPAAEPPQMNVFHCACRYDADARAARYS